MFRNLTNKNLSLIVKYSSASYQHTHVVTLIKYALPHPDKSTFYQRAFVGLLHNVITLMHGCGTFKISSTHLIAL
jgi:hypothetical protein